MSELAGRVFIFVFDRLEVDLAEKNIVKPDAFHKFRTRQNFSPVAARVLSPTLAQMVFDIFFRLLLFHAKFPVSH